MNKSAAKSNRFSAGQYKIAIMFLFKTLITAATAAIFLYLITNYYQETDFWFKGYVAFEFLYFVLLIAFLSSYRCYDIGVMRYREIVFLFVLATGLTNFIIYFVLSLTAKMMLPVLPLLVMVLAQWFVGAILYAIADRACFLLYPVRDALVVSSDEGKELQTLEKFKRIKERYAIGEVCSELEGFEAITHRIEPYSTVILGTVDHEMRLLLTDYCFEHNKRLFYIPTVQDIILHSSHQTFVGDSLMYQCKNKTFTIEQLAVKRLMDIGVSLLGLLLTSPIMLITAIAIKLYDGGPVFFKQERYTRNLTPFTLIKFRSMIVNAEQNGPQLTVPGDKRITPVGRFIRATRIDELPQFFNILRSEMSLVGPRAERIENVDYYCTLMPEFRYRMKVKAGLTGYAQIYGKYNTTYEDKLKMDLLYIENCSLLRDLQLLFLTVRILFIPESTEGFAVETLAKLDQNKAQCKEERAERSKQTDTPEHTEQPVQTEDDA